MKVTRDESFFEYGQSEEPTYWVRFGTKAQETAVMHDPVRIKGAQSVSEVLAWTDETLGTIRRIN